MHTDTKPLKVERKSGKAYVPWIVVGVIVVLALIASTVAVNLVRGNDEAGGSQSQQSNSGSAEGESTSGNNGDSQGSEPVKIEAEHSDENPPKVDPGQTLNLRITQWGIETEVSQKLGYLSYQIPDGQSAVFSMPLANELPESCADMRAGFGYKRSEDGAISVMRPPSVCREAPELYNEIWGLLEASVETIRPIG